MRRSAGRCCAGWPAKYYLLTCRTLTGEEAERDRPGVSVRGRRCRVRTALSVARDLSALPASAVSWTKYSLNNWYRRPGRSSTRRWAWEFFGFGLPESARGSPRTARAPSRLPSRRGGKSCPYLRRTSSRHDPRRCSPTASTWEQMRDGAPFRTSGRTVTRPIWFNFVTSLGFTEPTLHGREPRASRPGYTGRLVPGRWLLLGEVWCCRPNVLHGTGLASCR